jgi:integrase
MSLEIRKSSKWWYGVFMVEGERTVINLGVPITGKRPPKRTMLGDDEFERSRGKAMEAYAKQRKKLDEDRTGQKALTKLAEMKTGREVTFPALADLPKHWEAIPRRKTPDERYADQCRKTLERFTTFAAEHQRGVKEFVAVKSETAKAFMAAEEARGVSPKTWNDTLKLLRATFKHLHPHLPDGSNPFHGLVTKSTETVNREPFTVEELKAITEACAQDDFIRPIIVTGMCTAMRRGDCCLLKWDDVDLAAGFITVKTAKTGETVDIPVFPMLREELERAKSLTGGKGFCFPDAAKMYETNPDGITWRVKQVLAKALDEGNGEGEKRPLPPLSSDETRSRGLAYIDRLGETSKAERMREVFTAYMDGQTLDDVIARTGCSRGTVSITWANSNARRAARSCAASAGAEDRWLQVERENGKRRASVRDFTRSGSPGLPSPWPVEYRSNWFSASPAIAQSSCDEALLPAGAEDFRQAILKAMPKMLGEGAQKPTKEGIRQIIDQMTVKTGSEIR